MIRKDVVIAVLATFCLTATLFLILPIKSNPSAGDYDSWADIDDNGKIDLKDIGAIARMFGATGDPAKPVIMNNNWTEFNRTNTIYPQSDWISYYNVTGFKKVTLGFSGRVPAGSCTYSIFVGFKRSGLTDVIDNLTGIATSGPVFIITPPGVLDHQTRTYEVTGSEIWISIYNPEIPIFGHTITATVSFYMTT
jgi:hypothetical protein